MLGSALVRKKDASEAWKATLELLGDAKQRLQDVEDAVGVPGRLVKVLFRLSSGEPRSMRDLADHFGCDASYVTCLVDELEDHGLAERRPLPGDRRVKTVVLTERGVTALERARQILWDPPAAFSVLSTADLKDLRRIMGGLAAAASTGPITQRGR